MLSKASSRLGLALLVLSTKESRKVRLSSQGTNCQVRRLGLQQELYFLLCNFFFSCGGTTFISLIFKNFFKKRFLDFFFYYFLNFILIFFLSVLRGFYAQGPLARTVEPIVPLSLWLWL